jgi:hypothetical protein
MDIYEHFDFGYDRRCKWMSELKKKKIGTKLNTGISV